MKKILFTICLLLLSSFVAYAKAVDEIWYTYNGYSGFHNFKLEHPADWKPKIVSETLQVFSPSEDLEKGDYKLMVREFEGKSFEEAKNYYLEPQVVVVDEKEEVFASASQKLLSKVVTYKNQIDQSQFQVIFLQRGTLLVSLLSLETEINEDLQAIYKTFQFADDWENYFDETSKYFFIYPKALVIKEVENAVQLYNSGESPEMIFEIKKFADADIETAIELSETNSLEFDSRGEIFLNGAAATEVSFQHIDAEKPLSYVFIKSGADVYRLNNLNIEKDFPVSDYYNDFIQEMLASFQFTTLQVKQGVSPFTNLSDVPKDHPNGEAINNLFEKKVINGYPDGTFKPDDSINRAELTKLVVAASTNPSADTYKNCFPDVKNQWFARYICYAKEQGWVSGYEDGKFKPSNNISRVEAMKIILLALYDQPLSDKGTLKSKTPLDVDLSAWYGKYFIFADNSKLLDKAHIKKTKDNYYYYPTDNISRKEVAQAIFNLLRFFP